jgi:tetratricopeptide (TPR) repeat protein
LIFGPANSAHNQLGQAYLQQQKYDQAIAELQKAIQLSEGSPTCTANLACAYAVSGRRDEAVQLLGELKKRSRPGYSYAPEIAVIYAALGDRDQAMTWLETGRSGRWNIRWVTRVYITEAATSALNDEAMGRFRRQGHEREKECVNRPTDGRPRRLVALERRCG